MHLVFAFLGGLILLFIIAPLLGIFLNCTPQQLAETAAEQAVRKSVLLTLWVSMSATLVMSVAAVPFAYLLARKDFPLKRLVTGIIDLPVVVPHSAAGIAILGVLSRSSLIGGAADKLGFSIIGTPVAIMTAMAFVSLPFLINAARDAFSLGVPLRLEKAALNLGASPTRVFFTISLPLAWRGILSGLVMMWARGMSEFGAVVIVAYHPMIAPVMIFERFNAFGLKYARPVAAVFLVVCFAVFVILRLLAEERHDAED